jgi:hypothetical protein
MNFVGQYPFASQAKNDYPECGMCTWVYRELDGKFWLKFLNAWCPDHVSYGSVLYN